MTIPYRDEQILRILADHPTGLTTGQILAIAKTQRANELPNSNITSQRIYALRETKEPKIESRDTADGRSHKITAAGRKLLGELDRNNPAAIPTQQATVDKTDETPVDLAGALDMTQPAFTPHAPDIEPALETDENQTESGEPIDVLQQFDRAVAIIREALVAALNGQAEPIKIVDKRAKIELFEKLENMPLLEVWAAELIGEIRADLDQLDSA